MKTAEQWMNEVGDAMGLDLALPHSRFEDVIRAIQADALKWALEQVVPEVPDGDPALSMNKIEAKITELEQQA